MSLCGRISGTFLKMFSKYDVFELVNNKMLLAENGPPRLGLEGFKT